MGFKLACVVAGSYSRYHHIWERTVLNANFCCTVNHNKLFALFSRQHFSQSIEHGNNCLFGLNIFYFIYMKRDWAEHRCYVEALSHSLLDFPTCGFQIMAAFYWKQSTDKLVSSSYAFINVNVNVYVYSLIYPLEFSRLQNLQPWYWNSLSLSYTVSSPLGRIQHFHTLLQL